MAIKVFIQCEPLWLGPQQNKNDNNNVTEIKILTPSWHLLGVMKQYSFHGPINLTQLGLPLCHQKRVFEYPYMPLPS